MLNTRPRKRFDFKAPEDMIYKVLTEDSNSGNSVTLGF
ncbi:hypothetical protein [uncultured Gammaproteobacteria bacterium]|nr:hypothetical protein [uncultured Gammaproteobacteria bacterium]